MKTRFFTYIWLAALCASSGFPACSTWIPTDLSYDPSPQAVIIKAKKDSFPGGGPINLPFCNELPDLIIWGNGRVIQKDKIGLLSAEKMTRILGILHKGGFFGTPTVEINEAGMGFTLTVNLKSVEYESTWNDIPDLYKGILSEISPELKPYNPEKATLLAAPFPGTADGEGTPTDIPEWPAESIGFSLGAVPESGMPVTGEAAAYIWRAILKKSYVTRFTDNGVVYAISLVVPDFLEPRRKSRCW